MALCVDCHIYNIYIYVCVCVCVCVYIGLVCYALAIALFSIAQILCPFLLGLGDNKKSIATTTIVVLKIS